MTLDIAHFFTNLNRKQCGVIEKVTYLVHILSNSQVTLCQLLQLLLYMLFVQNCASEPLLPNLVLRKR